MAYRSKVGPARTQITLPVAVLCLVALSILGCGSQQSNSMPSPPPLAPGITSLNPTSGLVGASVTITGANFGATQGTSTVTFNGTAATPTSWNGTGIVAPVPAGATTGNVVVTVGGVASNGVTFTVTVPAPNITSLSVSSGPVGTPVTITGTNFGTTQGTSTVTFNGTLAEATSWGATGIVTAVPSGATTGDVVVTVVGAASNGVEFTVTSPPPTPVFISGERQVSTFLAQGSGTSVVAGACDDNAAFLPYHFCLPDSSLAGNAIIAACTWGTTTGVAASLADDKGQNYTAAFGTPPNDGSRTIQIWYVVNSAVGVHELSLNFSGDAPNGIQCGAYQVQNLATTSPSCGTTQASGTGTSVAAGSFTPVADNCFIFQLGIADSAPSGTWTTDGSFTLQDVSVREGFAVQTLVQGTAAAINPTLTMSSSDGWVSAAIALKAESSGSTPAGMHVQHISQNALVDGKTSYTFQFPCSGNLVVVAFNGNTGESLTSVTGTNPTSGYTQIGSGIVGGEGVQQIWQSPANIACTQNHTITVSGSAISAGDVMFYDVTEAATSFPSDSDLAIDSGNQSGFSSPLSAAPVTPTSDDGIPFCTIGRVPEELDPIPTPARRSNLPQPQPATGPVTSGNLRCSEANGQRTSKNGTRAFLKWRSAAR